MSFFRLRVEPGLSAPLEAERLAQANQLVGGLGAVLVIDDTALLKKGTHSVDVGQQYTGSAGKFTISDVRCQSH
jgi:SRSO17 transposase